jgi:hypothetical protein
MNSVVQPKQTTPVFVVALLLFGFAIAQSVHAVMPEPGRPPNHPVFPVNVDVDVSTSQCPGETVHLSGELHLHFKTDQGVALPNSCSDRSTLCAATLEGVTGTGVTSGRTYVASNPFFSDYHVRNSKGTWIIRFHVIGMPNSPPQEDVCPGCIFRFTLEYTVKWESRNGKVHSPHAQPEVLCP